MDATGNGTGRRREQQRSKLPWNHMEDDAMKIRALLARYAFLVGALALALILSGLVAFLPQAAGQGGMASSRGWSASQPAPAETPLPPGTQGGEPGSSDGSVAAASEALSLAAPSEHLQRAVWRRRRAQDSHQLAANSTAGDDVITLNPTEQANCVYTLTAVDNTTGGANGLPVFSNSPYKTVIQGNGATIERSSAAGTPSFRIFYVGANSVVEISDLTIKNGAVTGANGTTGSGGTPGPPPRPIPARIRRLTAPRPAPEATAGMAGTARQEAGGGAGQGGGVYVAVGGNLTLTNCTVTANRVTGGNGGTGGTGGKWGKWRRGGRCDGYS